MAVTGNLLDSNHSINNTNIINKTEIQSLIKSTLYIGTFEIFNECL